MERGPNTVPVGVAARVLAPMMRSRCTSFARTCTPSARVACNRGGGCTYQNVAARAANGGRAEQCRRAEQCLPAGKDVPDATSLRQRCVLCILPNTGRDSSLNLRQFV